MITDSEYLSILNQMEKSALGEESGDLSQQREDALDHFHGRKKKGYQAPQDKTRSSVVSRDLMETVLWMMPTLLRVFISGAPVEFDPVGDEDVELAEQETDIVNFVFSKMNSGFMVIYEWFWDALVQKNGYVEAAWETKENVEIQTYSQLTEDDLVEIMDQPGEVEIIEQDVSEQGIEVKLRVTTDAGRVNVENFPPEDVVVSPNAKFRLQKAAFVQLTSRMTRSDLLDFGYDPDIVETLPKDNLESDTDRIARKTSTDETEEPEGDTSQDLIEVKKAYARVDVDEDGKSELRKSIRAGNHILEDEETDSITVYSVTAFPLPHKHIGMSVDDIVNDIQEINTILKRQLLDNVYYSGNSETIVSVDKMVDINDWLESQPGGLKRVTGSVQDAAMPVPKDNIAAKILPVISFFEDTRETRTGVGRATQGLDSQVLRESTAGAFEDALRRSTQLTESVARIFAETGVRDLFLGIHELMIKHQNKARTVRIRGKFVQVNPMEWKRREDTTVNVGLGNNSDEDELRQLMGLVGLQEKAAQIGLVTPGNSFNLAEDIVEKSGIRRASRYFTDPQSPNSPLNQKKEDDPLKSNPLVLPEIIKAQSRDKSDQLKARVSMIQKMIDTKSDDSQFAAELAFRIAELEVESGMDLFKEGIGAELTAITNLAERRGSEAATGQPGVSADLGLPGGGPENQDVSGPVQ